MTTVSQLTRVCQGQTVLMRPLKGKERVLFTLFKSVSGNEYIVSEHKDMDVYALEGIEALSENILAQLTSCAHMWVKGNVAAALMGTEVGNLRSAMKKFMREINEGVRVACKEHGVTMTHKSGALDDGTPCILFTLTREMVDTFVWDGFTGNLYFPNLVLYRCCYKPRDVAVALRDRILHL